MELKVWRLHPQGIRLEKAEKSLMGTAHPQALKWCGPYTQANQLGFWVYPPLDIDIIWRGGNTFEHQLISEWKDDEIQLIRSLVKGTDTPEEQLFPSNFGGRKKVDFGRVENNICQMWTGCAFQTPPDWSLHIRSPININMDDPYRIQEGILQTDWLRYDIWINIAVQQKNTLIKLRRDKVLAQIVPMQEKEWECSEEVFNRETEESEKVYRDWCNYNYQKYCGEKEKDPATYHRMRSLKATPRRLLK